MRKLIKANVVYERASTKMVPGFNQFDAIPFAFLAREKKQSTCGTSDFLNYESRFTLAFMRTDPRIYS